MTLQHDPYLALALGPVTREQLDRWAAEHDRKWSMKAMGGRGVFASGVIVIIVLAATALKYTFTNFDIQDAIGILVLGLIACACLAAVHLLWVYCTEILDFRPLNPYRPIVGRQITLAGLETRYAALPTALAYIDAIRHQGRPIVPYDLDVLAMIRERIQSHEGA